MHRTMLLAVGLLMVMVMVIVLGPHAASAKGRDLTVFPHQAAWGETVYLDGFNWPGQEVAIRARFAPTRPGLTEVPLERAVLTARVGGGATFLEALTLDGIPGQRPGSGWVEFVAGSGVDEARALLVVTDGTRRPEGAGFATGRLMKLPTSDGPSTTDLSPPSLRRIFLAVAPATDPAAVQLHGLVQNGNEEGGMWAFYQTNYLEDGDWLVGVADTDPIQGLVAVGAGVVARNIQPREFWRELVWYSRPVRIRDGQPVAGVDFVLMRSGTAARVAALSAAPVATPTVAPLRLPSAGLNFPAEQESWTGGALFLTVVAGLLLGTVRLRRRAVCERGRHASADQPAPKGVVNRVK